MTTAVFKGRKGAMDNTDISRGASWHCEQADPRRVTASIGRENKRQTSGISPGKDLSALHMGKKVTGKESA